MIGILSLVVGNWQRVLAYGIVAVAIAGTIWMHGLFTGRATLHEYRGAQAITGAKVVIRQGAVTERVLTRYIEVAGKTQVITETIHNEVVRYADRNPGSCLDAEWRLHHDASAAHAVPGPARAPDAAGGAPKAAAALSTVTGNYAACHRTADRLDALQIWVEEQHQAGSRPP